VTRGTPSVGSDICANARANENENYSQNDDGIIREITLLESVVKIGTEIISGAKTSLD